MTNSENTLEASDKGLLSTMYKELLKLTKKKTTNHSNKWYIKDINQLTKERQMVNKEVHAFIHSTNKHSVNIHYSPACSNFCSRFSEPKKK